MRITSCHSPEPGRYHTRALFSRRIFYRNIHDRHDRTGAGIMVRNSVLIIDFIQLRLDEGVALKQAVLESGAVRTRPILLTAGTVVIGAIVILFDPIFQGLAIALMWGEFASTVLTPGLVSLIYYLVEKKNHPEKEAEAA